MKISQGWEKVDYYSSKASLLVNVIGGLFLILGTVMSIHLYAYYGLLVLMMSLLQYVVQSILVNACVENAEAQGKSEVRFPKWIPWIGWTFFYAKAWVVFTAIIKIAEVI